MTVKKTVGFCYFFIMYRKNKVAGNVRKLCEQNNVQVGISACLYTETEPYF